MDGASRVRAEWQPRPQLVCQQLLQYSDSSHPAIFEGRQRHRYNGCPPCGGVRFRAEPFGWLNDMKTTRDRGNEKLQRLPLFLGNPTAVFEAVSLESLGDAFWVPKKPAGVARTTM